MIAIRGIGSKIAQSLIAIDQVKFDGVVGLPRNNYPELEELSMWKGLNNVERYLICQGVLFGKSREKYTNEGINETYYVNFLQVIRMCNYILENNSVARICIIGSESGFSGSYDEIYAISKHLLHNYVETKKIKSTQQLVCIAPSIIEDAGMTTRRTDRKNLDRLREAHPKGRFLSCNEVARMIHFLLYVDVGYTTGVVIRMNGGKHIL